MKQIIKFILDENYSKDLWAESRTCHVWIVESENNTPKIKDVWERDDDYSQLKGVTSIANIKDKVETFYEYLDTIDMHHGGDYPDIEEWKIIKVMGLEMELIDKDRIENELETRVNIRKINDGFWIIKVFEEV